MKKVAILSLHLGYGGIEKSIVNHIKTGVIKDQKRNRPKDDHVQSRPGIF